MASAVIPSTGSRGWNPGSSPSCVPRAPRFTSSPPRLSVSPCTTGGNSRSAPWGGCERLHELIHLAGYQWTSRHRPLGLSPPMPPADSSSHTSVHHKGPLQFLFPLSVVLLQNFEEQWMFKEKKKRKYPSYLKPSCNDPPDIGPWKSALPGLLA